SVSFFALSNFAAIAWCAERGASAASAAVHTARTCGRRPGTHEGYPAIRGLSIVRGRLLPDQLADRLAHVGGTLPHLAARRADPGHLLRGSALAARDDRAGVPHAAPRRRRLPGDEADDRLAEIRRDPRGGVFLGAAADLADHDHRVGLGIVCEQGERV